MNTRHFFPQNRPSSTAPVVKRIASRYCTGSASSASFIMKKELPQIKAAANSIGFASRVIHFSLILDYLVIAKELMNMVQ